MSFFPLPLSLRTPIEILVVDDSRMQVKVLKDLLQDRGFLVRTAADGREVLGLVREQKPTPVISDAVMPVMNGYDLCFAFKGDEDLRDVPVITGTSLASAEDDEVPALEVLPLLLQPLHRPQIFSKIGSRCLK